MVVLLLLVSSMAMVPQSRDGSSFQVLDQQVRKLTEPASRSTTSQPANNSVPTNSRYPSATSSSANQSDANPTPASPTPPSPATAEARSSDTTSVPVGNSISNTSSPPPASSSPDQVVAGDASSDRIDRYDLLPRPQVERHEAQGETRKPLRKLSSLSAPQPCRGVSRALWGGGARRLRDHRRGRSEAMRLTALS